MDTVLTVIVVLILAVAVCGVVLGLIARGLEGPGNDGYKE